MPKYTVLLAANVRAYASVTIEAADEEAAYTRAEEIVAVDIWHAPEMRNLTFDPDWEMLSNFEVVNDPEPIEEE